MRELNDKIFMDTLGSKASCGMTIKFGPMHCSMDQSWRILPLTNTNANDRKRQRSPLNSLQRTCVVPMGLILRIVAGGMKQTKKQIVDDQPNHAWCSGYLATTVTATSWRSRMQSQICNRLPSVCIHQNVQRRITSGTAWDIRQQKTTVASRQVHQEAAVIELLISIPWHVPFVPQMQQIGLRNPNRKGTWRATWLRQDWRTSSSEFESRYKPTEPRIYDYKTTTDAYDEGLGCLQTTGPHHLPDSPNDAPRR